MTNIQEKVTSTLSRHLMNELPLTGYLRLCQIVGDKRVAIPPLIPISKASWWKGVKIGKYPKSIKLGPRTTVWRVEDIRALIQYGADWVKVHTQV